MHVDGCGAAEGSAGKAAALHDVQCCQHPAAAGAPSPNGAARHRCTHARPAPISSVVCHPAGSRPSAQNPTTAAYRLLCRDWIRGEAESTDVHPQALDQPPESFTRVTIGQLKPGILKQAGSCAAEPHRAASEGCPHLTVPAIAPSTSGCTAADSAAGRAGRQAGPADLTSWQHLCGIATASAHPSCGVVMADEAACCADGRGGAQAADAAHAGAPVPLLPARRARQPGRRRWQRGRQWRAHVRRSHAGCAGQGAHMAALAQGRQLASQAGHRASGSKGNGSPPPAVRRLRTALHAMHYLRPLRRCSLPVQCGQTSIRGQASPLLWRPARRSR